MPASHSTHQRRLSYRWNNSKATDRRDHRPFGCEQRPHFRWRFYFSPPDRFPTMSGARLAQKVVPFDLKAIVEAYDAKNPDSFRVDVQTLPDGPLKEFIERVQKKGLGDT